MFVPFGKRECFGSGQLALLATADSQAAGCPAVSRPGIPPPRLSRNPCQALIREGGGYNERPASKASPSQFEKRRGDGLRKSGGRDGVETLVFGFGPWSAFMRECAKCRLV